MPVTTPLYGTPPGIPTTSGPTTLDPFQVTGWFDPKRPTQATPPVPPPAESVTGNKNYYYVQGDWFVNSKGADVEFAIGDPEVAKGGSHSVTELLVAASGPKGLRTFEIGWDVDPGLFGDRQPHFFSFVNNDGYSPTGTSCYDCHFVASAYAAGVYYPGVSLANLVTTPNITHFWGVQLYQGNWWIIFEHEFIGYIPGEFWNWEFTTATDNQAYGEVYDGNGVGTDMGNGFPGSNASALLMRNPDTYPTTQPNGSVAEQALPPAGAYSPNPELYVGGNMSANRRSWRYGGFGTGLANRTPDVNTFGPAPFNSHSATLEGFVCPIGLQTVYHFDYGRTTGYGSSTPTESAGSGENCQEVRAPIEGLEPGTTYHTRLVGENSSGVTYTPDHEFTTPDWRPIIENVAVTSRQAKSLAISGKINPQGQSSHYAVEYGIGGLEQRAPIPDASVGSGSVPVSFTQTLSGLQPEANYKYRVVATNAEGTRTTEQRKVTTLAVAPEYISSFGSFGRSIALAVDSEGNVWAADRELNRLQKFSPSGTLLATYGKGGSGNGEFSDPRGVAVGPNGRIWVVDEGNDRVEYFSPSGTYEGQLKSNGGTAYYQEPTSIVVNGGYVYVGDYGKDAVIKVAEGGGAPTTLATLDSALQELGNPNALAVNSAGKLFATNAAHDKIVGYTSIGGTAYWNREVAFEDSQKESTDLVDPIGLAVKPSGNFVVSDSVLNRIEIFSPAGSYEIDGGEWLATAGGPGEGAGQFKEPMGLALGPGGNIYVADAANHRIERWNQRTKPEVIPLPASGVKAGTATLTAKIDPAGLVTTYHFEYGTSTSYGTSEPVKASAGNGLDRVEKSLTLTGLERERLYHYRIVATNSEGTTYGPDQTFTTVPLATSASFFGSQGAAPGQFEKPRDVAVDASGNVWTTDRVNDRLQEFDSSGKLIAQFGKEGSGNGEFKDPRGIAIGANGRIWVVDSGNNRVEYFSSKGVYEGQWAESYVIAGHEYHLEEATAITVTHGYVYISDESANGVIKKSESGGTPQVILGAAPNPAALASDSAGDVFVGSYNNHEILEVPAGSGSWQSVVKLESLRPTGILVKPSGNLLIAEKENNRLALYRPSSSGGTQLATFGSKGSGGNQFVEPFGLAQGANGTVYIADLGNHRIDTWTFE